MLIATLGTGLRRVPGVNFDHGYPFGLCLVGGESQELGKAPTVHPSLSFALTVRDVLANVGEVLKHQGTAWHRVLDHAFRKHMVMVSSLPKQFSTQLFQVSFCRLGAFGL